MKVFYFLSIGVICLRSTLWAVGNDFIARQRNIIPGGRSLFLGGAYTALSDDPSGLYFNPAGLAQQKKASLSITGNAGYRTNLNYKEAVKGQDFVERAEGILPTFVGASHVTGAWGLGYALINLDVQDINQNDQFVNVSQSSTGVARFNRTHQESNHLRCLGAGVAYLFASKWSLGVSVLYYQRTIMASNHQMTIFNNERVISIAQKYTTDNTGIYSIFGLSLTKPSYSLGFSLKVGRALQDVTNSTYDSIVGDQSDQNTIPAITTTTQGSISSFKERNPLTARLGFSWRPTQSFLLSSDVIFHRGVEDGNQNPYHDLHDTLNYSLGVEVRLGLVLLRNGFFTNNSMFAKPKEGLMNQATFVNETGAASAISWEQSGSETSIGVVVKNSSGSAQVVADSQAIQEVAGQSMMIVFSRSVKI